MTVVARLNAFVRAPHTLTGLLFGALALAVATNAFARDESFDGTSRESARAGATGAFAAYAAYSALQGPETHMTRPHVSVWKVVHGLFAMYLLSLVFLLYQSPKGAQETLKFFWDDLGVPLGTKTYGADCRIYVPGHRSGPFGIVRETLLDEFAIAHFLGWVGKAICIRDWGLLWAYSVAFELCELTFEHWQPNFNECWWDMWVWDVMICNALGIVTGMWIVKFLRGRMYDWSGKAPSRAEEEFSNASLVGALKGFVGAFTPESIEQYTWRPTGSPARFLKCAFVVFAGCVFDLNLFFMKYVLHVPHTHNAVMIRLGLWFLMSNIAIREYYVFIEEPDANKAKMGSNAWLALAVLVVEVLVVVKNGRGKFTKPWPRHVLFAWFVAISATSMYLLAWQRRINRQSKSHAPVKRTSSRARHASKKLE